MITKKRKREDLQLLRDEALEAYMNREDFQYDVNADALYQHYKDQYTQLGKRAMQDTMGQAAALTGGYGSSYAQNVGQQAYQSYLSKVDDVIPELYQLAYDRYRDKGDRLYKTYQSWSQLEQQAAQQEQWEREYELEERKRQDANRRFELEQERKNSQTQTSQTQTAAEPEYDNGKVSEGNVKTMQRVLGLQETGKWTDDDRTGAGGLTADKAWEYYQKGQLQNYKSIGLSLPIGNIKTMERVLGLEEDGYWSEEDQKVAGGLTAHAAWKDYQQGKLQSRSRSGMSMKEWADLKKMQSSSSNASNTKENTPAVQNFIACTVTEDQAAERGVNSTEWKMMVMDRLNGMNMTMDEFAQLEQYYGLDISGGTSDTAGTAKGSAQKMSYAEYRKNTAHEKVSGLNTAVQQYFRAYQAFANSAVYDIQYTDYHNAASMRDNRVRTAEGLYKQADALVTALIMNEDIISGDYSDLLSQIISTKTGIDSIMDFYGDQAKHYSQWDTEEDYNVYLTTQEQLKADPEKIKREIAQMENLHTIYQDLVTREIGKAEEPKLAQLRQQYPSLDDLEEAIEEKKAYLKTVTDLQAQAKQNVAIGGWLEEYRDKSYTELQKIIGGLEDGTKKIWLSDYAETKKTKDDWKRELGDAQANLDYLYRLRSERDRLMQFQAMSPDTPGYVELKKQWEAYHNQFDGLDERIDALEKKIWEQERIVRYFNLSQNEDYAEKSKYLGGGDILQEMVNAPEMTGFLDNAATVGKLAGPVVGTAAWIYDGLTYDNLQHMTKDERGDFNYIYATEGKEAAKEYLEWLQYTLDERAMDQAMTVVSDATQSVPFLSQTAASLVSTPLALMGGVGLVDAAGQDFVNKITGENKPINYNRDAMAFSRASSTIRGTVAQNIADATGVINFDEKKHPILSRLLNGKSLADVYQLGMGMQDSAAVAALAMVNPVLGKTGVVLLSGAAGTQTMLDAVERGATDEQALTLGILSGAFEMLFEKYELDSLLNADGTLLKNITNQMFSEVLPPRSPIWLPIMWSWARTLTMSKISFTTWRRTRTGATSRQQSRH